MQTETSYSLRKLARGFERDNGEVDRYVDIGVTLHVVSADETGAKLVEGGRRMRILHTHEYGGILDTKAVPPRILADEESAAPQVWYCSEDQWRIVQHSDAEPVGKLALGGMGAGKTTAGVIWTYLRWLENLGQKREGGITAPTEKRLRLVLDELFKMFPRTWWSFNSEMGLITMCDDTKLRAVSTHRQSESQGSRIQGFNWSWWLGDEFQDQLREYVNIQARLRSGKGGRSKRLATVTAKDSPDWRTAKDEMTGTPDWALYTLLGTNSPFIGEEHWNVMRRSMTERDYRRTVLAEDLPSESRLYHAFDRKQNLRPIPLGARKITSIVLNRKTNDRRDALLIGHDPGAAKAGSVWLDAYELPPKIAAQYGFLPNEVLWFVRKELFTHHATHEQHATQAMALTRNVFGCNIRPDAERAHVRCQPLGQAEDKPDLDVMRIWQRVGFNIKFAKYAENGTGKSQIKKESRIGMLNTLFCDATGRRRLFLECDDHGVPATPLLLAAIETMERDHLGRPEHEEKNVKNDKSDLPAALGYALYFCEKESALALRADIKKSLG